MLFKARIDANIITDKDKLAEQLYIFLNEYVRARIKYESEDTKEDCIQDTIMFMLDKLDNLMASQVLPNDFNYEKYFYNRARSYISFWISKVSRDRARHKEYLEYSVYLKQPDRLIDEDIIDILLISKIASEYNLPTELDKLAQDIAISKLIDLGLIASEAPIFNKEYDKKEYELAYNIAHAIVDEYLVTTFKVKG